MKKIICDKKMNSRLESEESQALASKVLPPKVKDDPALRTES